jgi:hypothetical protein
MYQVEIITLQVLVVLLFQVEIKTVKKWEWDENETQLKKDIAPHQKESQYNEP